MNIPRFAITHRPVVLAFTAVLMAVGVFNFQTMSQREDPEITIRDALILTPWPGASARRVEELITDPLEEVLVEIPEIATVESKSMPGFSVIEVAAGDRITNVEQVWDDLRAKVAAVRLPDGVPRPFVDADFGDVYEIAFALHQTEQRGGTEVRRYSPRELEVLAERIEEEVEILPSVGRVEFWGNREEKIYVEFDSADSAKFALTANQLRNLFQARNIVLPGGELDTENARYSVEPTGEFKSIGDVEALVVGRVAHRSPVQLGDLPVTISRRYEEPARSLTRVTTPSAPHVAALVIGISMKSGYNISEMEESVVAVMKRIRGSLPPDVELVRFNDLPRQVHGRIVDFQVNLIQGVLVVLVIALLMMGWRPALVMAAAVPVSMIGAFALVPSIGIELEQFSIASLIIALGMVVDNAIIVSDNAVRLMGEGESKLAAVTRGVQQLAVAMFTSTLTTIAAFAPMLTIVGNAGEYIASLPIVVAATLGMSYVVAMLLTPIMCAWLLRAPTEKGKERERRTPKLLRYDTWIGACLKRPGKVVLVAVGVFVASLLLLPILGTQFFPAGERDQFLIKVWLPENAPIENTSDVARRVESELVSASPAPDGGAPRLRNAVTFVGTGGPRLMLTQQPEYTYPYYALIVVNTTDAAFTEAYAQAMRERLAGFLDARVTVDQFMLGPPVRNPVELRLSGPDHDVVERMGEQMVRVFKETPGTVRPFSNWGAPAGRVEIEIDSYAANLAGVTNADVAFTTSMLLSGAQLTEYREGDHLVPVMVRAIRDRRENLTDLSGIYVGGQYGKVPLDSVAKVVPGAGSSVIARRNGLPTVTAASGVEPGVLSNTVAARVRPKVEELVSELPDGYFLEAGGELEESQNTQVQVLRAIGISVLLMVLILTVQYNSLLKPAVILFAIPMGMIGVLLGLLITGWAMGFMAMLGLLSLGGIVINNAIVLVDFIESNVAEGQELRTAVANAGQVRMRPIILTTLTTIGGLLPLSLFGGALWAPMTNGMIFGLAVSTALTLFVIPSLYVVFVEKLRMTVTRETSA